MTEQKPSYAVNQPNESFEITEYQTTAAALAILREKYRQPFDVTAAAGLAAAKTARAEVRGYRVALEKTRAEIKAPALERCRVIDAEAKRITAELLAIEEPIDAAIKAEERRKEEEKAAQARAEAARVAALTARVNAIRQRVSAVATQDAATIRDALVQAQGFDPDPDEFAEQWPEAMKAIAETRQALETLWVEREALEVRQAEEAARLQIERETLARQQVEFDRQRAAEEAQRQAEQEELARLRAAEEARQQAEQEAQEQARIEQEQQVAEEQARLQAAQAAKPARMKARKTAKADPLTVIKDALAAGTLAGPEAIDQAYQLGFQAGENAARQAA